MRKHLLTFAFALGTTVAAFAQTTEKAALTSAPTAPETTVTTSDNKKEAEAKPAAEAPALGLKAAPKVSYSLSMGTSFSSMGTASYLQPRLNFQLNDRVRLFTSVTMLNVQGSPVLGNERSLYGFYPAGQHYLLQVGGDYMVNDKLMFSGSVWRDFTKMSAPGSDMQPFNYKPNTGFDVEAHYKITENFSVSGRVRYSNGSGSPYLYPNPYYGL